MPKSSDSAKPIYKCPGCGRVFKIRTNEIRIRKHRFPDVPTKWCRGSGKLIYEKLP